MYTAPVRPFSRVAALALAGVGVAFAWILLVIVFGLGSAGAHAEERDGGGLLDSVTGVVDDTVGAVTDTVSGVAGGASDHVVAPVLETVTAIAPPAAPVVHTVAETASAVAQPVSDVVDSGVVSTVTAPIVGVVTATPVVGTVATGLGVDSAVTAVSASIDSALSAVTGALTTVTDTAEGSTDGPGAGIPSLPIPAAVDTVTSLLTADADTVAHIAGDARTTSRHASTVSAAPAVSPAASLTSTDPAGGPSTPLPLGLSMPSGGLLTGSGGAGPGAAAALLAIGPFAAHRAWVRRHGLMDDAVPAGPPASTDVSPD